MGRHLAVRHQRWCPDDAPAARQSTPATVTSTASCASGGATLKPCAAPSPGLAFPEDADDGLVVMETMPVGDVVEVGHADYLSTMVELADFSSVKVRPSGVGVVEGWAAAERAVT